MKRYRFVQTHFPVITEGDGKYQQESGTTVERVVFDREFITGKRGAIRAAKRAFRRRISLVSPFSDDFRLYEIRSTTDMRLVLLPRNETFSYPPRRVAWSRDQTTYVLHS